MEETICVLQNAFGLDSYKIRTMRERQGTHVGMSVGKTKLKLFGLYACFEDDTITVLS